MLHRTYLIQRLKKPRHCQAHINWDSAFSFGCVSKGGFTDKGWQMVNQLFSFDYMGSAEFEFGSVPRSISQILEWSKCKDVKSKLLSFKKPVWVVYHKDMEKYVELTVSDLISDDKAESKLKERCGLASYIKDKRYIDESICGWLEIDNHFMFFTDKEMYENVIKAFGITG